jgi:hypothetical protein
MPQQGPDPVSSQVLDVAYRPTSLIGDSRRHITVSTLASVCIYRAYISPSLYPFLLCSSDMAFFEQCRYQWGLACFDLV